MKVVWKFPLEGHIQKITVPIGAEFLCVQTQFGKPCLWALVSPSKFNEVRYVSSVGTGNPISGLGPYVGSYQLDGGFQVFHVFEVYPEAK